MKVLKINPVFGRFVKRMNRFVAEVEIDGKRERVWMNNTGRLYDILKEGRRCICRRIRSKLGLALSGVEIGDEFALIDTYLQMKAFEIGIKKGKIPWLYGCKIIKRNPVYNSERFDYLLECNKEMIWAELKSAVMKNGDFASYPDCLSIRGRRHIKKLTEMAKSGKSTLIVFIAGIRAKGFSPNDEGDPEIRKLLEEAVKNGVEVRSLGLGMNGAGEIFVSNAEMPVVLDEKKFNIIEIACRRFNSIRSPEIRASPTLVGRETIRILFTGSFCFTCGFYDYFDDFSLEMEEIGIKAKRKRVIEFEGGAEVTYEIR